MLLKRARRRTLALRIIQAAPGQLVRGAATVVSSCLYCIVPQPQEFARTSNLKHFKTLNRIIEQRSSRGLSLAVASVLRSHTISHAQLEEQLPTTTEMDSPGSASSPVLTLVLDNVLPLLRKGQKWALPQLEQLSAKSLDMLTRHPAASLWTAGLMLLILAALVLTVAVALVLFFIFLGFSLILSGLIGQYGRASADCTAAAQTSSRLDEPVVKPAATNPTTVKSAAAACNVPDKKTSADASTAPEATTEPSWISFCAAVAYQQVVKPRAVLFWFAK